MKKITPCLWFNFNAEEAMDFYASIFKNTRVENKHYWPAGSPGPEGKLLTATFHLEDQEFMILNGGPAFKHTEAFSISVLCNTQKEIDEKWEKLTADGGQPSQCGWLKDKYGLSWQIVPAGWGAIMNDPDPVKAKRAMDAMLKMTKLDIKALEDARDGK